MVELGDVAGNERAERRGIARDFLAEFGAAAVEHVLEGFEARDQHIADRFTADIECIDQRFRGLAEGVADGVAAYDDGVADARTGLFQLGDHLAAALAQIVGQRLAGRPHGRVHFVGARQDGVGDAVAGFGQRVGEGLRARAHRFDGGGRLLREAVRDLVEAAAHHLLQADGELGEFVVDVLALEVEAGGEMFAGRSDGGGGAVAGGLQPVEQDGAALAQGVDHRIAGMAERQRDVLAAFGERAGDALGDFVDLVGDQVADRGDVVREIEVDAGDGVAHLLGLIDQRFALVGELAEQVANAHLVVVIGALKRGDFVVHQRFQLGGAGERALDAVAHGGDFAADGMTDGHDLLAGPAFGLREAHGDLGHGLGHQAQILRAAEHMGEDKEDDQRQHDRAEQSDNRGPADGLEKRRQLRLIEIGCGNAAARPEQAGDAGDNVGNRRLTAAQAPQHLSDGGTVVVGGAARRPVVARPRAGLRRLTEQV